MSRIRRFVHVTASTRHPVSSFGKVYQVLSRRRTRAIPLPTACFGEVEGSRNSREGERSERLARARGAERGTLDAGDRPYRICVVVRGRVNRAAVGSRMVSNELEGETLRSIAAFEEVLRGNADEPIRAGAIIGTSVT